MPALTITDLTLALPPSGDRPTAVERLSLAIEPGETLCLVGESGSGKSMAALATIGLLPAAVRVVSGRIELGGRDLLRCTERDMRALRGRDVAMIFQEPMTSLNPMVRVGDQIGETFRAHRVLDRRLRRERVLELVADVGLPDPVAIVRAFPHELSGGQRQRVMIAMALALAPSLLIADEPTTALDVTTQAQVLRLLDRLRREHGTAVLFITHDLGVVAEIGDRAVVLRGGVVVETGRVEDVLGRPQHEYTRGLLAAVPSLKPAPPRDLSGRPEVLNVAGLGKAYGAAGLFRSGRQVKAAADISFTLKQGETLGLVGESGSGKSTVGRCVTRLIAPDVGTISVGGVRVETMTDRQFRPFRPRIQMVFQDPFGSLNPRRTVGRIIADGPVAQGEGLPAALARAASLLDLVGLSRAAAFRFAHEFSGGQRQRIGIARALALEPDILVADEPVSALDNTVQAQILRLLRDLQDRLGLAMLFVTHDLRVAAQMCDRIAVMQRGRIVEMRATADMFADPHHAYTRALLHAVPGASTIAPSALEPRPEMLGR